MKRGKDICKELKAVRKRIAEENDIPLEIKECTYQGPCRGTCPRCEAEVRYLENCLANRLRLGKVATLAGLALGLASCGGVTEGEVPMDDTSFAEGTVGTEDSSRPEVPEGPETNIRVPDVGELEVVGDVEEIPPPPPPDEEQTEDKAFAPEVTEEGEAPAFVLLDTDPEFPGGVKAMHKFIYDNLQYPRMALENNITGKVYVTFMVETDGSITNIRILRDIGGGCGKEAVRVVKSMPKWKPGKQQGKVVRVQFNLPVSFVRPADSNAPTQQMSVDGVKVIVKN